MIDLIDDFYTGESKEMMVGGIAGTPINKFAVEGCTKYTKFEKILIIEGCQDYIGLLKNPIANVKHWSDLFVEEMVAPLTPFDPWVPKVMQEEPTYVNRLNPEAISKYEKIIVFDAHLIPRPVQKVLSENFKGQILWVTDAVEDARTSYNTSIPIITDSLSKLSPIIAMARAEIGVDTRSIDTKVRGTVHEAKLGIKSIGKLDDKQYVTNDYALYDEVLKRQLESPFKKNQKVIVRDDLVDMMEENGVRKASVGKHSLLVIENANSRPLMKLRLYNSKITYYADIEYEQMLHHKPRGKIYVDPANIMLLYDEFRFHRYNHTVLVLTEPISKNLRYTVLKNSNNVTIVDRKRK